MDTWGCRSAAPESARRRRPDADRRSRSVSPPAAPRRRRREPARGSRRSRARPRCSDSRSPPAAIPERRAARVPAHRRRWRREGACRACSRRGRRSRRRSPPCRSSRPSRAGATRASRNGCAADHARPSPRPTAAGDPPDRPGDAPWHHRPCRHSRPTRPAPIPGRQDAGSRRTRSPFAPAGTARLQGGAVLRAGARLVGECGAFLALDPRLAGKAAESTRTCIGIDARRRCRRFAHEFTVPGRQLPGTLCRRPACARPSVLDERL